MPSDDDLTKMAKGDHTDYAPDSAEHHAAMGTKKKPQRSAFGKPVPAGGIVGKAAKLYGQVATGGASAAFNK